MEESSEGEVNANASSRSKELTNVCLFILSSKLSCSDTAHSHLLVEVTSVSKYASKECTVPDVRLNIATRFDPIRFRRSDFSTSPLKLGQ